MNLSLPADFFVHLTLTAGFWPPVRTSSACTAKELCKCSGDNDNVTLFAEKPMEPLDCRDAIEFLVHEKVHVGHLRRGKVVCMFKPPLCATRRKGAGIELFNAQSLIEMPLRGSLEQCDYESGGPANI